MGKKILIITLVVIGIVSVGMLPLTILFNPTTSNLSSHNNHELEKSFNSSPTTKNLIFQSEAATSLDNTVEVPSPTIGNACVFTDKITYLINETVTISGAFFLPDSPIIVNISKPCCCGQHQSHQDTFNGLETDQNGTFVIHYSNTIAPGIYNITASDGVNTAKNAFTVWTPVIWTDKIKYLPNETVTIFGVKFNSITTINITVLNPDNSSVRWQVLSDGTGNFTTTYQIGNLAGFYYVSATDGENEAGTVFRDEYITVQPSHALRGTKIRIRGYGFYGDTNVYFHGNVIRQFDDNEFGTDFILTTLFQVTILKDVIML
jgi:hypothetical protein